MLICARLVVAATRAMLKRARGVASSLAQGAKRSLSDGIVCSLGTIVAILAALTALVCASACSAPPPPANGSISAFWAVQAPAGVTVPCEQVGARSAALRLRNRSTNAVIATAFACAKGSGTASIAPGVYDVSFLLNSADGELIGTAPDQLGVSIISGRITELAPIAFVFGETPQTTVTLKIATSAQTNCQGPSVGGAGITGNTIFLARGDGGCAPVIFTRHRGAESRGTYQVNCSSPQLAPCIEKDETLTAILDRGNYTIVVRGRVGALDCWARSDTLAIPIGGSLSRTLGLQRVDNGACP